MVEYEGEKDCVGSQNKYAYTLGNPYKYVDRDGNRAFQSILPKRIPDVLIGVMGIVNGVKSIFDKAKDIVSNPPRGRTASSFPTNTYRSENRITPYKLPVAESSEAIKARQYKTSASFIASASCTKGEHKSFGEKATDWFVDKSEMIGSIAAVVGQLAVIIAGLAAGTVAAPIILTICGVLATAAGIIAMISGAVSFVKGVNLITQGIQNKDINTVANGIGTAILGVVGVCVGWQVLEQGLTIAKSGITAVGAWWNGRGSHYDMERNYDADFKNGTKLESHFSDHKDEFNYVNSSDYANAADSFFEEPPVNSEYFKDSSGWYYQYDPKTNTFGIMNPRGGISTFFKPIEGYNYWLEQREKYLPK